MNLEQRVAALESMTAELAKQAGSARTSARRWRAAALASGLALVAGVGIAANSSRQVADVITAESIEIVDGDDNVVMELSSDSSGGMFKIMNADGDVVGQWEVYDTGGYLSIRNPGEDELAVIRCDEFGGVFEVFNADGGRGASMEVDVAGGIIMVRSVEDEQVGAMMDILDGGGRVFINNIDDDEEVIMP